MVEYDNQIIPLEIKSGKDFKLHKALDKLLDTREYAIKKALHSSANEYRS